MHLILGDGAADEDDNALALILVLAVLERQLRDLHRRREVGLALDVQVLTAIIIAMSLVRDPRN